MLGFSHNSHEIESHTHVLYFTLCKGISRQKRLEREAAGALHNTLNTTFMYVYLIRLYSVEYCSSTPHLHTLMAHEARSKLQQLELLIRLARGSRVR